MGWKNNFLGAKVGRDFNWCDVSAPDKTRIPLHSKFPNYSILDLRYASVETLLNCQKSWPDKGKLLADGLVYEKFGDNIPTNAKFHLDWLARQNVDRFLPQPFEQLAGVLRTMGLEEDARTVMIAKNEQHRRCLRPPRNGKIWNRISFAFEWFWYKAFGRIIGYGYHPWNAFVYSLVVIVIGWYFFSWGYNEKLITPTDDKAYMTEKDGSRRVNVAKIPMVSGDYPKFNAFVYSMETFVPLVKLGLADKWTPNASRGTVLPVPGSYFARKYGGLLRDYLWLHIIAGWLLTTAWVAGLSGLAKT